MPLASYGLGEALVTTLAIFFLVLWFWILITIISDLFRDHETSGAVKALWLFALIFLTPLAAFVYLIFRGSGMRERAIKQQQEMQGQMNDYIREQAAVASPATELERLSGLHDKGKLTDAEYEKLKGQITGV